MIGRIGRAAGVVLFGLAGCSSTAPSLGNDGAADTMTTTGGMCGVGIPAGQACNMVKAMGATSIQSCVTGAIPAGTGGTILDGTYELTSQTYYNSNCSQIAVAETVVFSGNCLELATSVPVQFTGSGTFTVAGANFMLTTNCVHVDVDGATTMSNPSRTQTFTATPTSFTLFTNNSASGGTGSDTVAVFTRR